MMNKLDLLQLRTLKATPTMLKIAREDVPKKRTYQSWGRTYTEVERKYHIFMRALTANGILKVALYYPDAMRAGGCLPSFEVFIDKKAHNFLTYEPNQDRWLTAKLDRLEWPQYISSGRGKWISRKDERQIQAYFSSERSGYDAVLQFQLQVRDEQRLRRYKKEIDPWDKVMALIPALPKDWDHWVDKVGITENYIFYSYEKRGAKHGFCSYCGKEVPIQGKPKHSKTGVCPCCRHKVTYKSLGKTGVLLTEEACIYLIQSIPNGIVIREFWAARRYTRETYKTPEIHCMEHWRTVINEQLDAETYYWGNYKNFMTRWIAGYPTCSWMGPNSIYLSHGCKPGRVYGKTLPRMKKTFLNRTGLVDWIYHNHMTAYPDGYLDKVFKAPQIEQVWKAGLPALTEECFSDTSAFKSLVKKPEQSSLTKALSIDSQQLARLRKNDGGFSFLRWLQYERETGKPLADDLISWFCEHRLAPNDLSFISGKMTPLQVHNYLARQSVAMGANVATVLNTWKDYLSMAERLGIDTNDEIVYRVNLLRQRHDELVVRIQRQNMGEQAREILADFPNVNRICQSLKKKFEFSNEKYTVLAPDGVLDIIVEGNVLHHCVGSSERYWDRIERHEAYILFLRKAEAPTVPYYTLEIEPDGTVRQKRTKYDRQEADIEDATEFLREWQIAVSKRLTGGDRKLAAESRILREQEFEQMRKDDVRIHVGDLAGQRLVDVLAADLMEAAA